MLCRNFFFNYYVIGDIHVSDNRIMIQNMYGKTLKHFAILRNSNARNICQCSQIENDRNNALVG
jgi:hypothetical protein